jgi:hypothetical protein
VGTACAALLDICIIGTERGTFTPTLAVNFADGVTVMAALCRSFHAVLR